MVLGTPMGQPEFVRSRLAGVSAKHDRLVSQIVGMSDLQCAWVLLLHCASARPNYRLRVVHPALSAGFAAHHDATMRRALSQLVAAPPCNMCWDVVSLPFSRGGLGLRSAVLTTNAAYWASWAEETSSGGGSDFARDVSATCCRIPHCCGSRGIGGRSASCDCRSGGPAAWHARQWMATGSNRSRALSPRGEPGPTTIRRDGAGLVAYCLVSLSLVFLPARWHVSTLDCSGSCSSVVSGFLSLHLPATAGVAVSWTSLATTVQLVRRLECWVVGVLPWSQPLPEFVGRQVPEWALISWFVTWIWCLKVVRTVADSRWLRMDYRCFTEHNWPLTPHWCPQWDETVCHVHVVPGRMEQPSPLPDEEKRERILS